MSLTSILVHICICGVICTFYVNAGALGVKYVWSVKPLLALSLTQFETLNTSSLLIGSLLLQMFFCVCAKMAFLCENEFVKWPVKGQRRRGLPSLPCFSNSIEKSNVSWQFFCVCFMISDCKMHSLPCDKITVW